MNKIERVRGALAGQPVDRPPFTMWYHFGNQHAPAERTAEVHLEFFEHYDLDLLKLMNDYDYPMPAGTEVMATPADLSRLTPFDPADTPFGTQLRTVEMVPAPCAARPSSWTRSSTPGTRSSETWCGRRCPRSWPNTLAPSKTRSAW